jgi:hypothetical protein
MGGIDEAALDRLSLVVEMTKHIRVRSSGGSRGGGGGDSDGGGSPGGDEEEARELRRFTPSFLWLLRDFYLRLEDEHGRKVWGWRAWAPRPGGSWASSSCGMWETTRALCAPAAS